MIATKMVSLIDFFNISFNSSCYQQIISCTDKLFLPHLDNQPPFSTAHFILLSTFSVAVPFFFGPNEILLQSNPMQCNCFHPFFPPIFSLLYFQGRTITLRLLHGRLTAAQSPCVRPLRQIPPARTSVLSSPSGNSPIATIEMRTE